MALLKTLARRALVLEIASTVLEETTEPLKSYPTLHIAIAADITNLVELPSVQAVLRKCKHLYKL